MTGEDSPDEIGDWFQIEPHYDFQREMWRHGDDGEVLVVERCVNPWSDDEDPDDYQVLLLRENFQENPTPKSKVVMDVSEAEALEMAHEYIREHQ